MKHVIKDSIPSFVYKQGSSIYSTYTKLDRQLASIEDVKKHHELWDCPLVVQEGNYEYCNGEYVPR